MGLIGNQSFLATNGSILAKASDTTWERLKETGCPYLQLTVYGVRETHDEFAGRRGAFQDVVTTARRAREHGIGWCAGVILHPGVIRELEQTLAFLRCLDHTGESAVGWFPFSWQGRGRDAHRVRAAEYAQLPIEMRERRTSIVEERQAVGRIQENSELSQKKASDCLCTVLTFNVDRDLRVFRGGSCDGGGIAAVAPELRDNFFLGILGEEGFEPLLERYLGDPLQSTQLLDQVTWGELAEQYGSLINDEIYFLNDLPQHKWASANLIDALGFPHGSLGGEDREGL